MKRMSIPRSFAFTGVLLLAMAIIASVFASTIGASSSADADRQIRNHSFQSKSLQQMIQAHQLASTVQVLSSQPPSVIIQFPLIPSGVKKAFPKATGVVTIVQGNPAVSLFESVTVDVSNMPPDTTFTIFYIELANKPFGHVEYVADLHTRDDGSGEASGIQLEHLGMWFSSLQDAQKDLKDSTLKGTIFDGGNPPLHAGPQAMTGGQTAPVF